MTIELIRIRIRDLEKLLVGFDIMAEGGAMTDTRSMVQAETHASLQHWRLVVAEKLGAKESTNV